jgi:hypothetical protein
MKERRRIMIDCSKALNYVAEIQRMCKHCQDRHGCIECGLSEMKCSDVFAISEDHIKVVQRWSDEHPAKTMADRFFEIFPNAPKDEDGHPREICPIDLGWVNKCDVEVACIKCWNRPYKE